MFSQNEPIDTFKAKLIAKLPNPVRVSDATEIVLQETGRSYKKDTVRRALNRWGIAIHTPTVYEVMESARKRKGNRNPRNKKRGTDVDS